MAKIAIITDTHFGVRKNSDIVLASQKRFFNEQFFPYLRKNGIDCIFHLGDIFDSRPTMNIKIMNEAYNIFNNEFEYYFIVGNHDCYTNSSTEVNSLKLFKKFTNINVIDSMFELRLFDRKFLFVPWVFDEKESIEKIKQSDADVCFGHFDINGFSMGSKISDSSFLPDVFNNFKKVFSGHFHTQQIRMFGNTEFVYCGSPYQMDWGECGQRKGFYVFDTETLSYEFIENNVSAKHIKITYGEDYDASEVKNNYVKIFIKESETGDDKKFEEFTNKLSDQSIASMSTVVVKEDDELDNTIEISEKGQSLLELISEYVGLQETIKNKEEITGLLKFIYEESMLE